MPQLDYIYFNHQIIVGTFSFIIILLFISFYYLPSILLKEISFCYILEDEF